MHLAIVTGLGNRHPDIDQNSLVEALTRRGAEVSVAAWNDPAIDWAAYDAAVIRSTWDYFTAVDAFRSWVAQAAQGTVLLNPAPTVLWNSDKHYLGELAAAGVPVVPTTYVEPGETWAPPSEPRYVVKPVVSADSHDTAAFTAGVDDAAAAELAGSILASGRAVMVQPYQAAVAGAGETSLVYLGGRFSHAVRKSEALAFGGRSLAPADYYAALTAVEPAPEQLEIAEAALAAAPGAAPAYARVDVVPDDEGRVRLMEIELLEPALHLHKAPGSVDRLAEVLLQHAGVAEPAAP